MRRQHTDPRFLTAAWLLVILFTASIASALAAVMGVSFPPEGSQYPAGSDSVMLQDRRNNCGPAVLAMGMARFGVHVKPDALEREMNPTPGGVTLLDLSESARRRGLGAYGMRLTAKDLDTIATPAILFVGGNHFVLFDSLGSGKRAFLRDPAIGRRILELRDLEKIWKGEALVLTESPDNTDSLKHRTK